MVSFRGLRTSALYRPEKLLGEEDMTGSHLLLGTVGKCILYFRAHFRGLGQ